MREIFLERNLSGKEKAEKRREIILTSLLKMHGSSKSLKILRKFLCEFLSPGIGFKKHQSYAFGIAVTIPLKKKPLMFDAPLLFFWFRALTKMEMKYFRIPFGCITFQGSDVGKS